MANTYLSLHYHIVFTTKNNHTFIETDWRPQLHEYMGGIIRGLGGTAEGVGGVADHVHLLIGLRATHCLADVVRELKKSSSRWVHEYIGMNTFAWQEGYSTFTVSATACDAVRLYISNQAEHHRVKTFREELVAMLDKAGIEYDPKYLS
ncbi:MAG: IS200/IS605 family transposase [Verrucomicrobiota bacterium]|nr:IS200/IS605 family transposase [Verrucomicrobiota bacterium]